jgi:hypothetical protein
MSLWFRMGPVGFSSRGRVGIRMGPVSWYGGGRRRRSRSGGGSWLAVIVLIGLIAVAIKYWYLTIPMIALWALIVGALRVRSRRRHEQWLADRAPPLPVPNRFTQNWISSNVQYLHPGHVTPLIHEMRSRGWSDADIERRVAPYLRFRKGS